MSNIENELVVNKIQFNRIAQQHYKKFVKFNKLLINKDFIERFYINK